MEVQNLDRQKNRHGCLTAWLVFMLIANSFAFLYYIFGIASVRMAFPNAPDWTFPVLTIGCALNIVFAIAILRWKKWGFWGCAVITVVAFFVNLIIGVNILSSLLGLVGIALLYGVMQIGKDNKGWPQLD